VNDRFRPETEYGSATPDTWRRDTGQNERELFGDIPPEAAEQGVMKGATIARIPATCARFELLSV
jgi:hypothetical protein